MGIEVGLLLSNSRCIVRRWTVRLLLLLLLVVCDDAEFIDVWYPHNDRSSCEWNAIRVVGVVVVVKENASQFVIVVPIVVVRTAVATNTTTTAIIISIELKQISVCWHSLFRMKYISVSYLFIEYRNTNTYSSIYVSLRLIGLLFCCRCVAVIEDRRDKWNKSCTTHLEHQYLLN